MEPKIDISLDFLFNTKHTLEREHVKRVKECFQNLKLQPEIQDVLTKAIALPAAGINILEEDIIYTLGNASRVEVIKKVFESEKELIEFLATIDLKIFENAKGVLMLLLVDSSKFKDFKTPYCLHCSSFAPIVNEIEKKNIPFTLCCYKTIYEKDKMVLYLLVGV